MIEVTTVNDNANRTVRQADSGFEFPRGASA